MYSMPKAPVVSKEYLGNATFPVDKRRNYLFVYMLDQAGTIEIGNGGGKLPIPATGHYEPLVVPTSEFTVETAGSFILITMESTHNSKV